MGYETILVSKSDGVAVLTLNRPEVLNAMNFQLVTELDQAITEAEQDDDILAIVLTGMGDRAFTAGGDIHEQRKDAQELSPEDDRRRRGIRSDYSWHVAACSKPTIGALNGLAYGGGSVLASSLDMRVGCERSNFRFLAASYGRLNSTWTLAHQIGWPMAKELLFTGRVVEAEEAYRLGLLNHLVPAEDLMDKAMEIASTIAKNHPDSVKGVKRLLVDYIGLKWQEMWEMERDYLSTQVRSPGVEQAFREFIERRGR
jgi:enoyl-CoA hydratase/carnithine racemase